MGLLDGWFGKNARGASMGNDTRSHFRGGVVGSGREDFKDKPSIRANIQPDRARRCGFAVVGLGASLVAGAGESFDREAGAAVDQHIWGHPASITAPDDGREDPRRYDGVLPLQSGRRNRSDDKETHEGNTACVLLVYPDGLREICGDGVEKYSGHSHGARGWGGNYITKGLAAFGGLMFALSLLYSCDVKSDCQWPDEITTARLLAEIKQLGEVRVAV